MGGGILLNDRLDLRLAGLNFMAILAFTLVFEHLTEHLEHAMHGKEHFLQMVLKIYRELMILGFISLMLVLSIEFSMPWVADHRILVHFEFAHLIIFFWACVYTANALVASFRLQQTITNWDRVENTNTIALCQNVEKQLLTAPATVARVTEEAQHRLHPLNMAKDSVTSVKAPLSVVSEVVGVLRPDKLVAAIASGTGEHWTGSWLSLLPFSDHGFEDIEWKIMQRLFLRNFKLPRDFDYSKYLRLKLEHNLAESLDVTPMTWGIVIALVMLFQLLSLTWGQWGIWCAGHGYVRRRLGGDDETGEPGSIDSVAAACPADGSASDHRRRLGGNAETDAVGGVELTPDVADTEVKTLIFMGCLLLLGNAYVVYYIKRGIMKLIAHQGCLNPAQLSRFLRMMDAQLEVRHQMASIALFADAGEEFFGHVANNLKIVFLDEDTLLCSEGDEGDSMFFIVEGTVDVIAGLEQTEDGIESGGTHQVTLKGGDFCGEMSLLLGIPRSKALVVTSAECTIAVLDREQLDSLKADFPHVLDNLQQVAKKRRRLAGIDAVEKVSSNVDSSVHISPRNSDSEEGHGHKHSRGSRMECADEILHPEQKRKFQVFTEVCLLLNCFYIAFYVARVSFIVIPTASYTTAMIPLVHFLVMFPSITIMCYLAPMGAKYSCLLSNVLERDDELIAHVQGDFLAVLEIRNKMRTQLMHMGIRVAHEHNMKTEDITFRDVAKYAFDALDEDRGGTLSYEELRSGLPNFGIFLTTNEFKAVCRLIDPDQDQVLEMTEWLNFMQSSDDDLEGEDWKQSLNAVKLRDKIKHALLEPAMALYWETDDGNPPSIHDIVGRIFVELDTDGNGKLDYAELKIGLESHDLIINPDEFRKMVALVDAQHGSESDGDLSAAMFSTFMETTDAELKVLESSIPVTEVSAPVPARGPETGDGGLDFVNPLEESNDDVEAQVIPVE